MNKCHLFKERKEMSNELEMLQCDMGIHVVSLSNFNVEVDRIITENTSQLKYLVGMLEYNMQCVGEHHPTPIQKSFVNDQNYLISKGIKKPVLFLNLDLLIKFFEKVKTL